ncbi:MAG: Ppx/GppA family phosphatase [Rhodospirillales bacterium]|nr:Ppx/GppA family phosphatase [Rhodospirillales bacterium]
MLVAKPEGKSFRVIDAFSRPVRLGEGVANSGVLSDAAIGRTIDALQACAAKMRKRGVTRARHVATEACRRAGNCDYFLSRVAAETGLDIEIISVEEEARLALAGCAPLLDRHLRHALVFDIGGGSTELLSVHVRDGVPVGVEAMASLPVGVVTLAEQVGCGLEGSAGYTRVVAELRAALAVFDRRSTLRRHIANGRAQMLGTSGTVTTLGALHLGLPKYDRAAVDGLVMSFADIIRVSHMLASMTAAERVGLACIGTDRADLVVAGCAILEAICLTWPIGRLRVADRGVREGVLMGLMHGSVVKAAE